MIDLKGFIKEDNGNLISELSFKQIKQLIIENKIIVISKKVVLIPKNSNKKGSIGKEAEILIQPNIKRIINNIKSNIEIENLKLILKVNEDIIEIIDGAETMIAIYKSENQYLENKNIKIEII